jgi:diguanylate cyclase (GGDEF)-like protein
MPVAGTLRTVALAAAAATLAWASGEYAVAAPLALAAAAVEAGGRRALAAGALVLIGAVLAAQPTAAAALAAPASLGVLLALRARLERERDAMRRSALRDPLTGLGNRRMLDERLRYELTRHARNGQRLTVLALDLDGFKAINDRFGHDAGDEVLQEVALALADVVRAQDTVVRLGGDEFCVLAPDTDRDGAERLTIRVREALAGLGSGVAGVSASVGTAVFPDDAEQADRLLAAADAEALERKRRRRGGAVRPARAA